MLVDCIGSQSCLAKHTPTHVHWRQWLSVLLTVKHHVLPVEHPAGHAVCCLGCGCLGVVGGLEHFAHAATCGYGGGDFQVCLCDQGDYGT